MLKQAMPMLMYTMPKQVTTRQAPSMQATPMQATSIQATPMEAKLSDDRAEATTSLSYTYFSSYLLLLYQTLKITLSRQPKCFCCLMSPWPILVPPCIQQWSLNTDLNLSVPPPGSHSIGVPTYDFAPLNIEKLIET